MGAGIAEQTMSRALAAVNTKAGQMLTAQLKQQTGAGPLPGGVALTVASPIDIKTTVDNPLPNGTGTGLSAFYSPCCCLLAASPLRSW